MTIPLSRPLIGDAEVTAVADVLRSGHLASGRRVEQFETAFARAVQVDHALAVTSGTTALELALRALQVGPGDEVVVPSFTFIATANVVRLVGARPVFADVDPTTYCVSAETVEPHLTPRTAAVIAVHLYGNVADAEGLAALCRARDLPLIEDAAQALGGSWKGRPVGSLGTIGAFSFYPTKNITTGEGGMVTTSDPDVADRLALLRNHGSRRRYEHEIIGTNARMTDIGAVIGIEQLAKLDRWQARRREIATAYDRALGSHVRTPAVADGVVHAYHQYTVLSDERSALQRRLQEAGIGFGVYYETPCHRQKPYVDEGSALSTTDRLASEVLSLPIRPDLTDAEVTEVIRCVNATGRRT